MCGIAGLLNTTGAPMPDTSVAVRMASRLAHRGPDEESSLVDGPVAFGFRRLAIIDLATGQQPISNEQGNIWVMFNGEIYNFVELRQALEARGHVFRTQSDTEVIVHAYESFGLDFVQHLRGMFAIALWDSPQRRLVLARDRIGKKPLFYSHRDGQLCFASELKALLEWPALVRSLDARAIHDYLSYMYVPGPATIFEGVHKLPPANLLVVDCGAGTVVQHRYWRLATEPDRSKPRSYYIEGLREILAEAVRLRLRSDVPLGALLSGGVDSTIVVGLMAREAANVHSFSIGFPEAAYDETKYARIVAASFRTVHTEKILHRIDFSPDELMDMVWYMDEPFGDSSFIPTYWVSNMARKRVTVALSGDGGDELFAGYTRYRYFQSLSRLAHLPGFLRNGGSKMSGLLRAPASRVSAGLSGFLRQAQKAFDLSSLGVEDRIWVLSTYFDEIAKYRLYSPRWSDHLNGYSSRGELDLGECSAQGNGDPLVHFMSRELETSLVDDILAKVDRASMSCSLEVRSPFLDHHVVEFAARIPPEFKLHGRAQKVILKQAFADLLPLQIARRQKHGFEIPVARWFQAEPWRSFLLDMLSEDRIRRQGIFDPVPVMRLRDRILGGAVAQSSPMSDYQLQHRVWMLLVFQVWHERFMNEVG